MKPERNNKDSFRRGNRDGYRRPEPREEVEENENQLEGRNALTEALRSGRTIDKVFVAAGDTDKALARLSAMAKDAGELVGIEIVPEAVECARENAARNGITNAEFAVGAAEEVIPRLYEEEGITADIVVVDPPRKGCDEKLLETILQISPEKIVYVSCNPATWARDLVVLKEGGYELKEVQPVDQFSHSVHVEVVSLLQKQST